MHPNPTYRRTEDSHALAVACNRGFGMITAACGPHGLFGAHVPFVQSGEDRLHFHLMRANPLAKAAPIDAMWAVTTGDAYVSPDWYEMEDQVPTWLYGAIHIYGQVRALPDETLEPMLVALSDEFENRIEGKTPWKIEKMTEKQKTMMMRAIQPFEFVITSIDATAKFAQPKPAEALEALAPKLEAHSFGANVPTMAASVRKRGL